ncbi:MAG: hypothetical protein OXE53_11505 [Deltaproteobacteria bacterium]|nr:hypothetical protein [Deltaproteobacteria bacterium]
MSGAQPHAGQEAGEPRVRVTQTSCARSGGDWRIAWRITNLTSSELQLLDARFPHGKFLSGLMELGPVRVAPSGSTRLEAVIACNGGDGDVVENAFLITTAEWQGAAWRVLARMTVRFAGDGAPTVETELVTVQRVGFSGPGRVGGLEGKA